MELASVLPSNTHRPKVPQFCCDRGAGPMVRIHFPPAASPERTLRDVALGLSVLMEN